MTANEKNIGRDSRWTSIYWGFEEGELRPFVRLTPNFVEMEKLGFPHGLCVSPAFATEEEANLYAERIDAFIEAMTRGEQADAEVSQPSYFLREAVAPMGRLPRWVKLLLVVQFVLALLSSALLTMMLSISAEQARAMHQLTASVTNLRDVQAMNDLASVFQTVRKESPWWTALCLAATASSAVSALVVSLIPRKRAKPTDSSVD